MKDYAQFSGQIDRVVVINDTAANTGGTAALALRLAASLRDLGHQVTYLCGDAGENPMLTAKGVQVIAAGGAALLEKSRLKAALDGLSDRKMQSFVEDYVAEHDTPGTVYHVHAWAQILSPSIFRALSRVAPRVFVHAHDMFLACPNGVYMDYRKGEVCTRRPLSGSCIMTNCDKRAYAHKLWRVGRHSALRKAFDMRLPWGGILQIHPLMQPRLERAGLRSDLIQTVRNPAEAYCDARVQAEANSDYLFVGRLEADKGAMLLAEAAAKAEVGVTFVGTGPLGPELASRFPQFHQAGFCNRTEIGKIAISMRALVMPSTHPEPFALVIPEAVQSGLPVLVSDNAFMASEVQQGGFGRSFAAGDVNALAQALRSLSALPPADIKVESERCWHGGHVLSTSPNGWVESLNALYHSAITTSVSV